MKYNNLLTYEAIMSKGYDLKLPNKLNQGDFATIEEAVEDFIDEIVDKVFMLIAKRNTVEWTTKLFQDMDSEIDSNVYPKAYQMQQLLKEALVYQALFIYDNGDKDELSKVDIERVGFNPKTLDKLLLMGVL